MSKEGNTKGPLDVVGIGNAIVDVLSKADDAFLATHHMVKGTMALIEAAQAEAIYSHMGPAMEISGGSAANTAAAIASLGGKAGFIGKVANDQLGAVFRHDIRAIGVEYKTLPLVAGVPTARSMILMTPDGQRTMNTFLGASSMLTSNDLDHHMIMDAKVTYLEGYLFDREHAKQAFRNAAAIAHAAGKKVALTLSDPFCVERHHAEFLELVKEHVDILFANEAEIKALYKLEDITHIKPHCELVAITRSEKGSVIIHDHKVIEIKPEKVAKVIDSTGAGDVYAAGFLYGYTQGMALEKCGHIASVVAADIIQQIGARPQKNFAELIREKKAL